MQMQNLCSVYLHGQQLACQTSPLCCLSVVATTGAEVNLRSHTATVPLELPEAHLSGCDGWVAMLCICAAVRCIALHSMHIGAVKCKLWQNLTASYQRRLISASMNGLSLQAHWVMELSLLNHRSGAHLCWQQSYLAYILWCPCDTPSEIGLPARLLARVP